MRSIVLSLHRSISQRGEHSEGNTELMFNFFAFIAAVGVLITEYLWKHWDQSGAMKGATLAPDESI